MKCDEKQIYVIYELIIIYSSPVTSVWRYHALTLSVLFYE